MASPDLLVWCNFLAQLSKITLSIYYLVVWIQLKRTNICQIGSNWIIFPKDHPWTFQNISKTSSLKVQPYTVHAYSDESSLDMDSLNHPSRSYCHYMASSGIWKKNRQPLRIHRTQHPNTPTTSSLRQVEDNITKGIFLHCFSTRLSRSKHSWGCDRLLMLSQIDITWLEMFQKHSCHGGFSNCHIYID